MDPIIRAASLSGAVRRLGQSPQAVTPVAPVVPAAHATHGAPATAPTETEAELRLRQLQQQVAAAAEASSAAEAASSARLSEQVADALADAERRGLAQGLEQAHASARALVQDQLHLIETLASALRQARARVLEDGEDMIVEIAFGALCRILGEQGASREGLLAQVRTQLAAAREPPAITVRLHPDDVAVLAGALAPGVQLAADSSVDGGCVLDGPAGTLDARLELQLAHLRDGLLAVRAERQREGQQI